MDRLSLMEIYIAVVEHNGLAAAARTLGVSPPVVTRAINALEKDLGVQLVQRTTRAIRVTELGQQYLADCYQVLDTVNAANARIAGSLSEPQGRLIITAPVMFGRIFVMPVVTRFLKKYPNTKVTARFLDRVVDMVEEGIDIAIRIGPLADSSYRARKIGESHIVACASKQYIKRFGEPRSIADLEDHTLIASTAGGGSRAWDFGNRPSRQRLQSQVRLEVSSNDAAIAAAEAGLGITRVLSYQVAEKIKSGKLLRILRAFEPGPQPINVVHHEDRQGTAAMRKFIELLDKEFTNRR